MAIISPLKKIFNWQTASEKIPYKVYTALFTQANTDAPVVQVLENTLGFSVNWSRTSAGLYAADFPYKLNPFKIWIGNGMGTWAYDGNTYLPITDAMVTTGYYTMYFPGSSAGPTGIAFESVDAAFLPVDLSVILGQDTPAYPNYGGIYIEFRIYN
jgi:hypothetical protein